MKLKVVSVICAALSVASVYHAYAWWSKDGEPGFGKLSNELKTPHIDFASKCDFRPTVLVTAFGAGQREAAELWERFDMTPVLLPTLSAAAANPWELARRTGKPYHPYLAAMDEEGYREELEKILAKLPTCDAIVLGKTDLKNFPKEDAARLVGRVRDGAGLIYITHEDKLQPIEGVELKEIAADAFFPVGLIPALAGTKLYEGTLGKGRVLEIVYKYPRYDIAPSRGSIWLETLTPYDSDDALYYDFYHAFLGKAIWRVTGREVKKKVGGESRWTEDGRPCCEKKVGGESRWREEVKFFNALGEETEGASRSAVLKLTKWFNKKGETVDYQVSGALGDRALPARLALGFEQDSYPAGAEIPCRVTIPSTPNAQPSTPCDVRVTLTDERGRVVWLRDFPKLSGEVAFQIKFHNTQSKFALVKAQLREGRETGDARREAKGRETRDAMLIDEAFAKLYFNTLKYDRDDFCFSIFSSHAPNSRVSKMGLREIRRAGMDNIHECSTPHTGITPERRFAMPRWTHEYGLNFSAYTQYSNFPKGEAIHSKDCKVFTKVDAWHKTGTYPDPGPDKGFKTPDGETMYYRKLKCFEQDTAAAAKGPGCFFYSLGDELCLSLHGKPEGENCFCDACQARFRKYLERTFGSLENMNREYHTKYASWDDVRAMNLVDSAKARKLPLWMDFRAFMEEQFIEHERMCKAMLEEVDPGACIGFEGYVYPHNSFTGYCLYKMLPYFSFGFPYFNPRDIHGLRYLGKGGVKSSWFGTYESENTPAVTRRVPWQYLFSGLDGASWYCSGLWSAEGVFSNHCIFRPDLKLLAPFVAATNEMEAIRSSGLGKIFRASVPTDVKIAVHYSNPSLHASTVNPGESSWQFSHQEFGAVFDECSLQYEMLSPPEIEKDGIPAHIKVFAMPYSQAVSDKEAEAIRAFVERGGLLLADYMPGIMTEHGRLRESPLADLFGGKLELVRTGKGGAVLLEDYLQGADGRAGAGTLGGVAAGLARCLRMFGVTPFAQVTDPYGSLRGATFRTMGPYTFFCTLGPTSDTGDMAKASGAESNTRRGGVRGDTGHRKIALPHEMWAYDMNAGGREIGRVKELDETLPPIVGRVIAFTDKRVTAPKLTLSTAAARPGEPVAMSVDAPNGCTLFSAVAPDGRTVWTDRALDGKATFAPAWNEPRGTWTIRATSAIGGFVSTAKLEVK